MKTQKQGFVFKSSYYMTIILCNMPMQNKTPATTFGYIMALLLITIRIDYMCFDDGPLQSLFQQPFGDIIIINHYGIQYQRRNLSVPMKKTISLICLQSKYVTM